MCVCVCVCVEGTGGGGGGMTGVGLPYYASGRKEIRADQNGNDQLKGAVRGGRMKSYLKEGGGNGTKDRLGTQT